MEERKGKYPKDRVPGEGRDEMEVKIGHMLKKEKENVQNAGYSESRKTRNRSENWTYMEER